MSESRKKVEFGDFQTPVDLAQLVCRFIAESGFSPETIIEPTCGEGSFIEASEHAFPESRNIHGFEIDSEYVKIARRRTYRSNIRCDDFFTKNWATTLDEFSDPILIVGNPPWVTNSALGSIKGTNLPPKSNFRGMSGFDSITGKSNFDISEWMLSHLVDCLSGRYAMLAMLCKTIVARKVLFHAWKDELEIDRSSIHHVDASKHFGASVDACLFICEFKPGGISRECSIYDNIGTPNHSRIFGLRNGRVVADVDRFLKCESLCGTPSLKWRSGVKHDCVKVMELKESNEPGMFVNGFNRHVELETDFLYPMLKSSDLMKGSSPSRYMIVTQRKVGDDTSTIAQKAPLTWEYLQSYSDLLDVRASSIYKNRPRFSIFGIGDYSFSPWKVAISGFYKSLTFHIVPPQRHKPVMLDDTCYFLPCGTESEANEVVRIMNSEDVQYFFGSLVFWDSKRPINVNLLSSLNLDLLIDKSEFETLTILG